MPFYGGTKRALLFAPKPVFLPGVGPFAGLPLKLASSLPNRTISSNTDLSNLSSRGAPLEYNTLTITNGVISAPTSYYIAIRGNILNMTGGSFDVSGQNGFTTGSGGNGACGGGGGGGAGACNPCEINSGGEGGNEVGPALLDGQPGQDGSGTPGKQGGTGYGDLWKNDGFNYVTELGNNFGISNTPFLYGGYGSNGGYNPCAFGPFEGGNGGGCAGGVILQFNKIIGSGLPQLLAVGGGAETGGDGNVAQGGDGGWYLVYTKSYPTAFLNGRVNVNADPFGQYDGTAKLFRITGNSYSAVAGFGTKF